MSSEQHTVDTEGPPRDDGEGPELAVDAVAADAAVDDDDRDLLGEAAAEIDADLAGISAQRDEYLAVAQRLQAEFENYKKRVGKELADKQAVGKADLASKLLAVLDACDSAIIQGVDGIGPIHKVLFETLTKEGLAVIEADDTPFDPNQHDAVMHEPADGEDAVPTVVETLRTGYLWNGKVLRPAMVKVRG